MAQASRQRSGSKTAGIVRRFLDSRSGNFAMMTVVAMVPILGAVGLAVDYTEMSRQQTAYYNALDAAALVAAKAFGEGHDDNAVEEMARGFFEANIRNPEKVRFTYYGPQEHDNVISIRVGAEGDYNSYFIGPFKKLLNGSEADLLIAASAEVAVAATTVEMALVLDNSTSMRGTKITALRNSAAELVESLHKRVLRISEDDAVRFALVPFGASVNVGTAHANASWMDTQGRSPVHHENFDWTTLSGATRQGGVWRLGSQYLTRQWLYNRLNVTWNGCVEARPHPYNRDDTAPNTSNPATLFVPMFAPDEPDYPSRNAGSELRSGYGNNYISDFGARSQTSSNSGTVAKQYARQSWIDKYIAGSVPRNQAGPNLYCTTAPLLPLTSDKTAILRRISEMQADGYTNVAEGIAWGLRVLSPGEPFTEGRAYGEEHNIKAMVVMSDGENQSATGGGSTPNESVYGPYGYTSTGRIWEGAPAQTKRNNRPVEAIDSHMLASCEEAKAVGITVYTIAFDVRADSNVAQRLRECASTQRGTNAPLYYNAGNAAELERAFRAIGSHVSNLRLFM